LIVAVLIADVSSIVLHFDAMASTLTDGGFGNAQLRNRRDQD
jgi:hypothetical protein